MRYRLDSVLAWTGWIGQTGTRDNRQDCCLREQTDTLKRDIQDGQWRIN